MKIAKNEKNELVKLKILYAKMQNEKNGLSFDHTVDFGLGHRWALG